LRLGHHAREVLGEMGTAPLLGRIRQHVTNRMLNT
jgi:hypothetical protein